MVDEWSALLIFPHKADAKIGNEFFSLSVPKLAAAAFPFEGTPLSGEKAPERFLPSTKDAPPLRYSGIAEPTERLWSHVIWFLEEKEQSMWAGLHQTVRMLVQACSTTLFPEHLKTKRQGPALELFYAAALGVNEPLYPPVSPFGTGLYSPEPPPCGREEGARAPGEEEVEAMAPRHSENYPAPKGGDPRRCRV